MRERLSSLLLLFILLLTFYVHGDIVVSEVHGWVARALRYDNQGNPEYGVGPSWKTPTWNDGSWDTSIPSFSIIGVYSVYQRCSFQISATDPINVPLQLRINWFDGYIAYLNGVEVYRANMGTTPMYGWFDAQAFNIRSPTLTTETVVLINSPSLLQVGTNVFSIQVHGLNYDPLSFPPHPVSNITVTASYTLQIPGSTGRVLIGSTSTCKIFPGIAEPSGSPYDTVIDPVEGIYPQGNWIEFWNNGSSPIDLSSWSFTDTDFLKKKYVFPSGTTLASDAYLAIMTDERNYTGDFIHTNFKLEEGSTAYLYDSNSNLILEWVVPPQDRFYTYGIDVSNNNTYAYFSIGTPGYANDLTQPRLTGIVSKPSMSLKSGHYTGSVTVNITCDAGAVIWYTLDASEPTSTSNLYTNPLVFVNTTVLRAISSSPGMIISQIATETYIMNANPVMLTVPSLILNGDQYRALYKPWGIMTITGGNYNHPSSFWGQYNLTSYGDFDMSLFRGDFTRRKANFAIVYPPSYGIDNIKSDDVSIRISYSTYSRPYARLTWDYAMNNSLIWIYNDATHKPSINLGYSSDFGKGKLKVPVIPLSIYPVHDNFRLRAGKNDMSNPYIMDEWVRRVYQDMEEPSAIGIITGLWVNGVLKGFYNLVEKIDSTWLAHVHGVSSYYSLVEWDILKERVAWERGDGDFQLAAMQFIMNNSLSNITNYKKVADELIWIDSTIDYLIINTYLAMWDWPLNNLYAARQRTTGPNGRFRFYIWDAEGAMQTSRLTANYNSFSTDLIVPVLPIDPSSFPSQLFTLMYTAPEFQLRWADRVQQHFFNGGALTVPNLINRWTQLANEFGPVRDYLIGGKFDNSTIVAWLNPANKRIATYFSQLVQYNLWQTKVLAPTFTPFGASIAAPISSVTVTIAANSSGSIYYTTDGSDPRALGGAVLGQLYSAPLTFQAPTRLCSRVLSPTNTWSPIVCASYSIDDHYDIVVTEIMYNPLGGNKYQFLEIKNIGSVAIDLTGIRIMSDNITLYVFPTGTIFKANSFIVISADTSTFEYYYGWYPQGQLTQSFSTTGAELTFIYTPTGTTIFSVTYNDNNPWPRMPDGLGFSLVPLVPNPVANSSSYNNYWGWRQSAKFGGSPGADDGPLPTFTPIKVNELSPNPLVSSKKDWLEIYNPTSVAVDISNWWLTDDWQNPMNFVIPDGTVIPPLGFITYDSSTGLPFSFSSKGEELWLFESSNMEIPSGYYHGFKFRFASVPDTIYARYTDCNGNDYFALESSATPLQINSPPKYPSLGSIFISAFDYSSLIQYVEIASLSSTPISLSNWTLARDQNSPIFVFGSNMVLPPYGRIIISSDKNASLSDGATVVGPLIETLRNTGEALCLTQQIPSGDNLIDEVVYSVTNASEWPIPDSDSVIRLNPYSPGSNPCVWSSTSQTVNLTAVVWNDLNDNGVLDSTDQPCNGTSVCIYVVLGSPVLITCVLTNSSGIISLSNVDYPFIALAGPQYILEVSLKDPAILDKISYPYPYSQNVSADQTAVIAVANPPFPTSVSFPLVNHPFTIQGVLRDNNGRPLVGVPVTLTSSGVSVVVLTNASGVFVFSEKTNDITDTVPYTISVALSQNGSTYHVASGSSWTETGGSAVLTLQPSEYGRGINSDFSVTLSSAAIPPTTNPTSNPTSTLNPSSTLTPSSPPLSPPFFGPTSNQTDGEVNSNLGLLGIGVAASYAVVAVIAIVIIVVIIVVIVLVVKKMGEQPVYDKMVTLERF